MKRFFLFSLILIILCTCVYAGDVPEIGHQFYGYAGSGSTVSVIVNGLTFTTSVDTNLYYGYDSLFFIDAQSDDIDGAEEGDLITFYLDGVQVATDTFEIAGLTKLDFAEDPGLYTFGDGDSETDSDGDGIPDSEDVCEGYDDTVDTDNDGTPDGCDSTPTGDGTNGSSSSNDDDDDDDNDSSSGSSDGSSTVHGNTNLSSSSGCSDRWQCTSWTTCDQTGFQTRICYYVGSCSTEGNQSDTRQRCVYTEETTVVKETGASCYDGIQNQGERGTDCGGPCKACPTVPIEEEPKTNWLYVILGIVIILLIITVILGYKYKQKWLPYWEKVKGKFVKPAPAKASVLPQQQYRPQYPKQQYPQQQNYQYRK